MTKITAPTKTTSSGRKKISLALQGGGSHGAYTWGVLDSIFEDGRLDVEGVCGTSAGGMNATATAQGLIKGGLEGAREYLGKLWTKIGEEGAKSPLKPDPIKKMVQNFDISHSPGFLMMQFMSGILSPYQLNPTGPHPLEGTITELFDFKSLQNSQNHKLFLCATHVATGKLKIFKGKELTKDAVLASACVPTLFKAIEVDGEFYWDGGFIGNPAIYPLIYDCETPDILVIQIRRVHDGTIPITANAIQNRLGEITQNSCLTREMRAISFVTKLIDDGVIPAGKMKRLHMHLIRDDAFFGGIDRTTGFCADPDFLQYLYKAGRRTGKKWITENFDKIGKQTTAQIESDFI
jgi:NTE family protein